MQLVSSAVIARRAGVTTATVRSWAKRGLIDQYKIEGTRPRYDLDAIMLMLTGNTEDEREKLRVDPLTDAQRAELIRMIQDA